MEATLEQSRSIKHPRSIAIMNYKGGVGKTTVTYLLGLYLALKTGREVLIVDIDAQCSLTFAVGFQPDEVSLSKHNIYQLVHPKKWPHFSQLKVEDYVKTIPGLTAAPLYIIPGAFEVEDLDLEITDSIHDLRERGKSEFFLYCKQLINSFHKYRYVLVDTPPNRMYLTQGLLRACNFFVPVTIPDGISIYGMPRLLQWVQQIPDLERPSILGYVLNGINRSGGSPSGMVISQQIAVSTLNGALEPYIRHQDDMEIRNEPCLGEIPRLDQIAKFMGANKEVRLDFVRHTSGQATVDRCLNQIADSVIARVERYHA